MIKINTAVVSMKALTIKATAEVLNEDHKDPYIGAMTGMSALSKYVQVDKELKRVYSRYRELVEKDVKDVIETTKSYEKVDNKLFLKEAGNFLNNISNSLRNFSSGGYSGGGHGGGGGGAR